MHQLNVDNEDLLLFTQITEQQRELARLITQAQRSAKVAHDDKVAVKAAEKRLHALLEETIADRPLFRATAAAEVPVAAAPSSENWINARVDSLELETETVHSLHARVIHYVNELIIDAARDCPGLSRDEAVDVNHALRAFRHQLDPHSAAEFDQAVAKAQAAAESRSGTRPEQVPEYRDSLRPIPSAQPDDEVEPEMERCLDCGGFLHLPTPARKPNAKKACHLVRVDGRARAMRIPPEEVRAKRENPPEIQPNHNQVVTEAPADSPIFLLPGRPGAGIYKPEHLGITQTFEELYAISSAASIAEGKLRGIVEVETHPYAVTGAMFSGSYREIRITPLCPATAWTGPTRKHNNPDHRHGYYGTIVTYKGVQYVLGHRDQAVEIAFGKPPAESKVDRNETTANDGQSPRGDTVADSRRKGEILEDLEEMLEAESDADAVNQAAPVDDKAIPTNDYGPHHPWYYKTGGRPLEFDEIEMVAVEDSEIESTYKLPKDPKKRAARLTTTLRELETELVKRGADYSTLVAEGPGSEDEGSGWVASSHDTSLSLAHNHVCYYKSRVAAVRRMMGLVEPAPAPPALKQYMVLHGPEEGPFERVCLIQIGGDILTAAAFARQRIGWQVYNFDHQIRLDGPGMETLMLAEGGRWLDAPKSIERNGESVQNNSTDLVPELCPSGKPRVYKVVYHAADGDRTLRFYSAINPKAAVEWAKRDYPSYQGWRFEATPTDDDAPARAAKKKQNTQRAVAKLFSDDDRKAQVAIESTISEPDE